MEKEPDINIQAQNNTDCGPNRKNAPPTAEKYLNRQLPGSPADRPQPPPESGPCMDGKMPRELTVSMLIRDISKIFHEIMDADTQHTGLQPGFRRLHYHLVRQDGLSQRELAERARLSPPTVSVALAKMEAAGLIKRITDDADARYTHVYLTEAGRRLDTEMRAIIKKNEDRLIDGLSRDEQEQLKALLLKIRSNIIPAEGTDK